MLYRKALDQPDIDHLLRGGTINMRVGGERVEITFRDIGYSVIAEAIWRAIEDRRSCLGESRDVDAHYADEEFVGHD